MNNNINITNRYSKKSIVLQAEDFGFGPTSIAISILENLKLKDISEYEIVFVGTGVAMQLAKMSTLFNRYVNLDFYDVEKARDKFYLLGKVKLFICVTSPSAAIIAKEKGVKVCYVEPLLWFFNKMDKRLENVDYFVIQNFTDSQQEFERLHFFPKNPVEVGWLSNDILNNKEMRFLLNKFCADNRDKEYFRAILNDNKKEYVLLNFGGVDSILLDFADYPQKICNIVIPMVQEVLGNIDIIIIGGGKYLTNNTKEVKKISDNIKYVGSVEQKFAKVLTKNAKYCFISPGLSNLFEMCYYQKNAFGLPAQNYSQFLQMKKFRSFITNWNSMDYTDIDEKYSVQEYLPEEEGVRLIEQYKNELLNNEDFITCFKRKIAKYLTDNNGHVIHNLVLCNKGAEEISNLLYKDLLCITKDYLLLTSRLDNNANLFKSIYNNNIESVIKSIRFPTNVYPSRFEDRELENAINNIWLTPKSTVNKQIDVITGGPCICYTEGDLSKLSFQDIIDILYLVIAAKKWKCKLLFVLTTYESGIQLHFNQEQLENKYDEVRTALKSLLFNFAEAIGVNRDNIIFADTSDEKIFKIISSEAEEYKSTNDVKELIDIYNFKPQSDASKDKDPIFFEVYVRNIVMYTSSFVAKCIGEKVKSYAVVENSTQLKAVQTGFNYSISKGYTGFLGHYVYLPVTSTNAIEMNHAEFNKGIHLFDTLEEIKEKLNVSMKKCNREYYNNIFPLFLLKKGIVSSSNIPAYEQIYAFLNRIKFYMGLESNSKDDNI